MKKRLESELISIAHRILKLKNKSEVDQLYKESQKLYETLSVLKFYQDNFESVKSDVDEVVLEEKLEQSLELEIAPVLVAEANEYGILAGRSASLIHPITNLLLFGTSVYSAYLGLQWRRLRDLGEELKELNKELPIVSTGPAKFPITDSIAALTAELNQLNKNVETDNILKIKTLTSDLQLLNNALELNSKISEVSATRTELLSMNLKDKHYTTGSILLGAGVSVSLYGALNTYLSAGELFPGPHLFAGMAITILWAGFFFYQK
jgi:hypothetical protein